MNIASAVITWGGGTLLVVLAKRRDFLLYAFDPQHARAIGLPVGWLHYGLLAMLSLTIVASLKAVGIILVVAMLIAPGAIAGKGKTVEPVQVNGSTLYRTTVTGFSSRAEAKAFCETLKAAGKNCFVK